MNQKKSTSSEEIRREIELFEQENKKLEMVNEMAKEEFSKRLKLIDPKEVKNSDFIKKKYTIWQRIVRTLGMN